jgi:hypothetical protein
MAGGEASSYLRLEEGRATPKSEVVDSQISVLYVDVAGERPGGWEGEVAEQLRFVDETVLAGRHHVLIRVPREGDPAGIALIGASIERRTGQRPAIAQVSFRVGAPGPAMLWAAGPSPSLADGSLLAAARSVEFAAILQAGKSHWRPTTFHYELPSGQHRADFIRVGDGFRSPRDARALATWLYPFVETGRAVLLDTSTLLPLVLALQDAANQEGRALGPVVIRDAYPDSLLSDEELIELTVGANGALALVSVSSTGHTSEALGLALERKRIREWWIECLVDRRRPEAGEVPTVGGRLPQNGQLEPWLHIPDEPAQQGEACGLCMNADRAPFVRIDPGSFANTSLPEPPTVVMPDPPTQARQIDRLLEMYRDVDGIGIDCDPAARTRLRRTDRRWGVRFHPHRLLDHPDLYAAIEAQLVAPPGDANDGRIDLPKLEGFDAIAYLDEDAVETDGRFEQLLGWLEQRLKGAAEVRRVVIPSRAQDADVAQLASELQGCSHILVVTVGTVTGGTLHELLARINRAMADAPKDSFTVSGLVLHARPPSYREWRSARSAYNLRLVALWMTYLPADDHPLAVEQRLFRQTLDDERLSEEAQRFADRRRRWILNNPQSEWLSRRATWDQASGNPNPAAVLLCGAPERPDDSLPRLQPNSLFGHQMSMIGTLVGVGAALHRARLEKESGGGPPGLRFDMTRIPVVYFEVPIICAVLRWLRPYEAFWEYQGRSAEDGLKEIWHQSAFEEEGNRAMLLAELLLAAASGKLPRHTYGVLAGFLVDLETSGEAYDPSPIEIGRQLVVAAWGTWPEPPSPNVGQASGLSRR